MPKYDRTALLERHPEWLDRLSHRCQLTGAIVGKHHRGRYRRYDMHHTHSGAYGHERPGWNYLLLSDRAHWFIHLLGGELLLRAGAVRRQNKRAGRLPCSWLWRFPNPFQRGIHWWCRMPFLGRCLMVGEIVGLVMFVGIE